MVKISTSLVIAAVAAQSIAAPIFETRQHSVKTSALRDISEGARLARKLVNAHTAIKNKADRKKLLEEKKLIDQALNGPQQQQQLERRFGRIGMVLHDGPRSSNIHQGGLAMGPREDVEELAAREPRGGFGGARGSGGPRRPFSFGGPRHGGPQSRELEEDMDIEAREPLRGFGGSRGGFSGPRPFGGPRHGGPQARELEDGLDIEAREPRGALGGSRHPRELEEDLDIEAREPLRGFGGSRGSSGPKRPFGGPRHSGPQSRELEEDMDIEAREPLRGFGGSRGGFSGPRTFGGPRHGGPQARELEDELDIEAREPRISGAQLRSIGHHLKSGIELAATVAPLIHQRSIEGEEEQLEARFRHGFGGHPHGGRHFGGMGGPSNAPMESREVDDIEAREPRISGSQLRSIGHHLKTGIELGATVAPLLQQREDFELDAREPFNFGKFLKGAAKGAGKVAGAFLKREDIEDDEMVARDFDDAELDARDPFFLTKLVKGAAKVAGSFLRREDDEGVVYARELEIDQLD